ncbi:hypothetical protein MNB_SV-9-203 [hydrothermal vent metagenome]|uniref:Roadblock/LAMTOR2 domain-containing protein n=1 Tax=hydrothermal vent metagenome TaxID=652676 RepID=A0A1W1BCL1_9ZZZZ
MDMNNIEDALDKIMSIKGAIAAAVTDWDSGMTLGSRAIGKFDIEMAAAGNAEVVKAKMMTIRRVEAKEDIKDILITLTDEMHIISMVKEQPELFLYVALNSEHANLALARNTMQSIANS